MYQTFEGMFQSYLIDTEEIAVAAWDESPEKQKAEIRRDTVSKKLLALIPPKKRRQAEHLYFSFRPNNSSNVTSNKSASFNRWSKLGSLFPYS